MSLFVHLLYCCTQWCSVASVISWSTLQAVIRAVQSGLEQSLTNLTVCTDSQYVLQSANGNSVVCVCEHMYMYTVSVCVMHSVVVCDVSVCVHISVCVCVCGGTQTDLC